MRLALAAAMTISTTAAAGPAEESAALYGVLAAGAASFVELMDTAASDPAGAAGAIRAKVSRPVSDANAAWLAAMTDAGPEAFLPFFPCHMAATSLDGLSTGFADFLLGRSDRPDIDLDVGYFREDFTRCEMALGLAPTFPDLAAEVSE